LKIVDSEGNVIREIHKKNTDTIIAKINTPTQNTLYMDIIKKPLDSIYGQPFEKVVKTIVADVDIISRGEISVPFSYNSTNKKYTAQFTYANSTNENV